MRGRGTIGVAAVATAVLASTTMAQAGALADRVSGTEKGSLLIYSKVEIRWDAAGNVLQDTFVDITNDLGDSVLVQMYFVNGDPSADAGELGPGERAHPGWNWVDVAITLTANQPAYWSALTGQPGPGGAAVSPFTILDPSADPTQQGRPAPDGSGDRVLRGFIYAWAVNDVDCPIEHNHLKGDATLVNYADGTAWEYNAWAAQWLGIDSTEPELVATTDGCGQLQLDGWDYTPAYSHLLLDFFAAGSQAFSGGQPLSPVTMDTDLTLHPVTADLRQETEGPVTTKANFVIWNENETQLTGLHRCITCWDQTLISQYAVVGNHFLIANLQTDKGKARIDGIQSQVCDVDYVIEDPPLPLGADPRDIVSRDAALLGVHAKHLSFTGGGALDNAGGNLIGMGQESAYIYYDAATGPGNPPTATSGDRDTVDATTTIAPTQGRTSTARSLGH